MSDRTTRPPILLIAAMMTVTTFVAWVSTSTRLNVNEPV